MEGHGEGGALHRPLDMRVSSSAHQTCQRTWLFLLVWLWVGWLDYWLRASGRLNGPYRLTVALAADDVTGDGAFQGLGSASQVEGGVVEHFPNIDRI